MTEAIKKRLAITDVIFGNDRRYSCNYAIMIECLLSVSNYFDVFVETLMFEVIDSLTPGPYVILIARWAKDRYHLSSNPAWSYLKVVSSLTSLHYLWTSLGPFSLPCAQKSP